MRPVIGAAVATRPSSCLTRSTPPKACGFLSCDSASTAALAVGAGVHAGRERGVEGDVLGDRLGDRLDDRRLLAGGVEAEGDVDGEADVVEVVLLVVDEAVGDLVGQPGSAGLGRRGVVRRRGARRCGRQPRDEQWPRRWPRRRRERGTAHDFLPAADSGQDAGPREGPTSHPLRSSTACVQDAPLWVLRLAAPSARGDGRPTVAGQRRTSTGFPRQRACVVCPRSGAAQCTPAGDNRRVARGESPRSSASTDSVTHRSTRSRVATRPRGVRSASPGSARGPGRRRPGRASPSSPRR